MDREFWKKMLPLIEHYANGGTIEFGEENPVTGNTEWRVVNNPYFQFPPENYRLKEDKAIASNPALPHRSSTT